MQQLSLLYGLNLRVRGIAHARKDETGRSEPACLENSAVAAIVWLPCAACKALEF
jgi:hypothetical protein